MLCGLPVLLRAFFIYKCYIPTEGFSLFSLFLYYTQKRIYKASRNPKRHGKGMDGVKGNQGGIENFRVCGSFGN